MCGRLGLRLLSPFWNPAHRIRDHNLHRDSCSLWLLSRNDAKPTDGGAGNNYIYSHPHCTKLVLSWRYARYG